MSRPLFSIAALLGGALPLLVDSALKGAAILALAALIALSLYRSSAATRHLVWLVALVALLILPLLSIALPKWRALPDWVAAPLQAADGDSAPVALPRPAPDQPTANLPASPPPVAIRDTGHNVAPPADPPPPVAAPPTVVKAETSAHSWSQWVPAVWAAGVLLLLLRLASAHLLLRRSARRCAALDSRDKISTLVSRHGAELGLRQRVAVRIDAGRTIPLVWGIFRPHLLLPAEARASGDDQLRSVILHELAHLKRRDPLAQWLTQLACALHWWNPLAWIAAWRIHVERERACDDLVLASGVRASAYAEHLLDVATKLAAPRWSHTGGLAMAQKSSLESRLHAVLAQKRNRRRVTAGIAALALAAGLGVAIPVAMLRAADDGAWEPPQSAHTGSGEFSAFCVHDGKATSFVIAYRGDFDSSAASSSNAETRTWNNTGTLTAKGPGIALSFHRDHTAPDKLSLTTAPAEPRNLGKPAPPPREFGQREFDLADGRVFLLTDSGLVRQFDLPTPPVTDPASAKKLAALIDAIPPQEEQGLATPQPEHERAQSLFSKWQDRARTDGKIPGALIGHVGEQVEQFIKQYPDDEAAPKLAALRGRFDVSRDWEPAEVAALLDEVAAISTAPVGWADLPMEFNEFRQVKPGAPLPADRADAAWGEPAENGLRAAWILEPKAERYPLGTVLKARVAFHNAGDEPVVFRTETWHQSDEHIARDADGAAIKISGTFYTGITPLAVYRLLPGEYCEGGGHGIAIGAGDYKEEFSLGQVGAIIEARAGDEVTLTHTVDAAQGIRFSRPGDPDDPAELWAKQVAERVAQDAPLPRSAADRELLIRRVMRDLFGTPPTPEEVAAFTDDAAPEALDRLVDRLLEKPRVEPWTGKLPTGESKFRVTAADPNAAKAPRVATSPGRYVLGDGVHLQVTQTTSGGQRKNKATIQFLSPDPKVASPHEPYEIGFYKDDEEGAVYALAWERGEGILWVTEIGEGSDIPIWIAPGGSKPGPQKVIVRAFDFSDPAAVKVTHVSGSENEGGWSWGKIVPEKFHQPVLDALGERGKRLRDFLSQPKPMTEPEPDPGAAAPPASAPVPKIDWSEFPAYHEILSKPFDPALLAKLASAPERTPSERRELACLLLMAAVEKDPQFRHVVNDESLKESTAESHSLALSLAAYDFSVNGSVRAR